MSQAYQGFKEEQYVKLKHQAYVCQSRYGDRILEEFQPSFYNNTIKRLMCPAYWDGIYCWPNTPAGSTAVVPCPSYFIGYIETNNASRQCNSNGSWFSHLTDENIRKTWSNYTACSPSGDTTTVFREDSRSNNVSEIQELLFPPIKILATSGYAASLISLIIAFAIMFFIKKLHCARNILHMNLFASFILKAFILILKDILFVEGIGPSKDMISKNGTMFFHTDVKTNNYECKIMTSLIQYFTTANYSWILMEGLYLNNLIFRALFADSSKNILHYIFLGWGMPMMVIIPWIVARVLFEDDLCWTKNTNYKVFLIIVIPTFISNVINLILFVIISIVLYSKLRSPINEDSRRYQKWAKSTLVLVPLFGVHYSILLIFYFLGETNNTVQAIWLLFDITFGSFQGFFVAILYCFLNGEVKSELKPYMHSLCTYLATNKYFKFFFPCREKYLRSVVGRTSVCTTVSCSSLYTNGVHHRNSRSKLGEFMPKNMHPLTGPDKTKDHVCLNGSQVPKRGSYNFFHKHSNQNGSKNTVETTLCTEDKTASDPMIIEEEMEKAYHLMHSLN